MPGTFIFPVEGCKQEHSQLAASKVSPKTRKEEAASVGFARNPDLHFSCQGLKALKNGQVAASKVRSAPKLAKKKQLQLVLPGTLGRHRERSGKHHGIRHRETSVRHRETRLGAQGEASGRPPEPAASQHLASDCRDWGTQGTGGVGVTEDTECGRHNPGASVTASQKTARHRETSGRRNPGASATASHNPGASVTASGIQPQRLGDKRQASGIQRHSIWHPTAKTDETETPEQTGRYRRTAGTGRHLIRELLRPYGLRRFLVS